MTGLDVSVVVPTYNRGSGLEVLLDRLLDQEAGVSYEVVVVDNNSTDDTRAVVHRVISRDPSGRLRYVFEPRQGVSYARNTGVEQTSAPIILFLDDDGLPGRDWARTMKEAFDAHPEAHCIGGRVKADWRVPPPSWMEKPHWGPIAQQDRPEAVYISARSAASCLLGANLGVRREVFDRVGGFSPDYPRNQDREWEMRVWRAGMQGLYLPSMDVVAIVPPARLTKRYHRRWQATTGMYHALMRYRDTVDADGVLGEEPANRRTFLGVPLFMYRGFASHVAGWMRSAVLFRSKARFFHETRLWYYVSFFRTRWANRRPTRAPHIPLLRTVNTDLHASPGVMATPPDATILICTFNRAAQLLQALRSLAGLRPSPALRWDVLIVDNNSSDGTRRVVEEAKQWFPVPLHYLYEARPGKSNALNAALARITARVIVFTDDDVRVPSHWLDAAVAPLLHDGPDAYTGGPVRSWWGAHPPSWLEQSGNQAAPLAALHYGEQPFVFEERRLIPLGANMAVRRSVFEQLGGFHPELGRTGRSLLGQEQAEFFQRCRAAGLRGRYVPEMWIEHFVSPERLTMAYFSRWWYWKGISQARWHRMHGQTETGVDLSGTAKLRGVPLYAFRAALVDCRDMLCALLKAKLARSATHACLLLYFVGYCRECWFGRSVADGRKLRASRALAFAAVRAAKTEQSRTTG